eukprot:CAMPEP_0194489260 /NCGR_PEP_ID=MMETSP0253-20130528/8864_1 /TAXON_ID=2966 /ORGANISM="Noctiluca scintillans" /LENGTH=440 /DNA_ID=CAMNT_0039329699 /DNA_START=246 /DNA_END=1568 /DNA_ORIENTATION=-
MRRWTAWWPESSSEDKSSPTLQREDSLNELSALHQSNEITAMVPCYLPNEQEIIEESLLHILEKLDAPGKLHLWLVYNTPYDMPEVEKRLAELSERTDLPRNRRLTVLRAPLSKSKADNLNFALELVDTKYVAIYDADHHPDPDSLVRLYTKMQVDLLDCAQGSTYIRNLEAGGILGRMVDAEFFFTHFMLHPSSKLLTRIGYFGGSNAIWDVSFLRDLRFRNSMQTEDIDLSFRALMQDVRIDFCPEARSGELAPVNILAFLRQRIRWTVGWDQVALDTVTSMSDPTLSCCLRLGMTHLLYTRWFLTIVGFFSSVIMPYLQITGKVMLAEHGAIGMLTLVTHQILTGLIIITVACTVIESFYEARHRKSFVLIPFVGAFLMGTALYMSFQLFLSVVSLSKLAMGKTDGWYVSPRTAETTEHRESRQDRKSEKEHLMEQF